MKAIPTIYNGVQYRSLLEARWAAFFELAGIRATYEPEGLAGYIPDFHLHAREPGYSCLVEVKGLVETFDIQKVRDTGWGSGAEDYRRACNTWRAKADRCDRLSKQAIWDSETERRKWVRDQTQQLWVASCVQKSKMYGNVLLCSGEGPRGVLRFVRHGNEECQIPVPLSFWFDSYASVVTDLNHSFLKIANAAYCSGGCGNCQEAVRTGDPTLRCSNDAHTYSKSVEELVDRAWKQAGNLVQWKSPRRRAT